MPDFNAVDYFARQSKAATLGDPRTSIDKLQQIEQASAQKYQELDDRVSLLKQRQVANASSWVGKLGLNPDGAAGEAVNAGAHLLSGTSYMAGDITGLLTSDLPAVYSQAGLTDEQKAAVSRYHQGSATDADKFLINHRPEGAPAGFKTPLEAVEQAAAYRQRGQDIRDSFREAANNVHTGDTDALSDQLRAGFQAPWDQTKNGFDALWKKHEAAGTTDLVGGMAKLVYNAGKAAVDHPMGAAGYMAENAPQLVAGAAGRVGEGAMMMSNIGYASDYYQQGLQNYAEQHNGAVPDDATQSKLAAWAASLALAEHAGNVFELKHAMGAARAVEEGAKTGLVQSIKNVAKAAVHGGAEETATEGYQGYAEGQASLTPASAADVYENAILGGLVGAGLSGGGRSVGEITKSTPEHVADRAEQRTRAQAQDAAIQSGDVSALVDPKRPTYAPANAIAALHGNSQLPDTTEEAQQANLEKANKIVADLHQRHADIKSDLDASTPEALQELKDRVEAATAAGKMDDAANLRTVLTSASQIDRKATQRRVDKLQRQLDEAHENMARFHEDTGSLPDVNAAVQAISAPVDESDTEAVAHRSQAATSLINLSMASKDRLDTGTATALAEDPKNGLSDEQRTYLRDFSAARTLDGELKDTGKVGHEVYAGGDGNTGISQYRDRVTAALATGNRPLADQQMAQLAKFAQGHQAKATAFQAAWEEGRGTPVVQTKDGVYHVEDMARPYPQQQVKRRWVMNSRDLVANTLTESRAVTAAHKELTSAYALKFFSTPTTQTAPKGAAYVQDVSQAHDQAQNEPAADASAQAVGGNAASTDGSGAHSEPGSPGERPGVPAGGVTQSTESSAVDSVESQASPDAVAGGVERTEGQNQYKNSTIDKTTESQSSPESAEQTSEQVGEAGRLSAMAQPSAEGAAFNLRNLIADYFTQSQGAEDSASLRPLVAVKDFLSQGWGRVTEFVQADTEAQVQALRVFQERATVWASAFQENLARRNREFWFTDMMQFLMTEEADGKLDLDENTKTAMSAAAFSWIAENAARSPVNTDEEINLILGRDEDHPVEDHERAVLLNVGTRQNVVSNALGQRAMQALGLKVAKNAPGDLSPKLESALGAHIFKMLMDEGILERTTVSAKVMAALTGSDATDKAADHYFLRQAKGENGKPSPKVDEIFQASRGTGNVLAKLFSVEAGLKEPSQEPISFTQRTTRNTSQAVPSKLAEIIERENAVASYVRRDMYDLVNHLSEDIALQIAGGELDASSDVVHAANRPGLMAKADALTREIQRAKEFFTGLVSQDDTLAMPLYFDHTVWKQQRVGIATNMINPQTSKVHRHMLYRQAWETKVAFADQAAMDNFRLRVSEGLGVKTDKQSNDKSLSGYNTLVSRPTIQDAVAVLQKRIAGSELSQAEQETLLAGVKAGGEDVHSLDALMALAHEANAKAAGETSFITHMMGEVDGVTNGPMLSHLLMGAAASVQDLFGLLNRGGFFEVGNEHNQYNLWREAAGHFDLYETTALHMTQAVQGVLSASKQPLAHVMEAIYGFTGTLADKDGKVQRAGRNIIKTPLTAMVFGSSVGAAVESMANKFIESIYSGIEDVAKSGKDPKALIESLNIVLLQSHAPTINPKTSIADLMEHQFAGEQLDGLKKTFKDTIGKAVRNTMETDFASYIERRKQFNLAAQLSFDLYNGVYTALREQMVRELMASGDIAVNAKTGKPLHDLTSAQEGELRKRLADMAPMLHTPMSKQSDELRAGLYMSKSGRNLSDKPTHEGEVKFGKPFADNGAKSTKTRAYEVRETAPGVAMAPMAVHSTDSAISHHAADGHQVLNVHDAHGAGLANFEETARNLNRATWNQMLAYSPASEMHAALSRVVVGLAGLVEQGTLSATALEGLVMPIETMAGKLEVAPEEVLSTMMQGMKASAFKADDMKLHALSQMQAIDQYALQGGNYKVTEQDRADASALRAGLSSALSTQEQEAVATVSAALQPLLEGTSAQKAETPLEEDGPAPKNAFGPIGTSNVASDPSLVAFFRANPNATARQVIKHLYDRVGSAPGRMNEFNSKLLKVLAKTVSPDMVVRVVTPQTAESDVMALPKEPAHGWFVASGDKAEINLLSPEFEDSGLTSEVLMHELTHGALAQIVARELDAKKANPGYKSEALELINELEALRTNAAAYAKQQGITNFASALGDIQEFITWGMTSQAFQRQVISQVSLASTTGDTGLVNGMKKFIGNLVGLLFKGSSKTEQERSINGMTTLVSNVSGLFNQAAQEADTAKPSINLSMASNPMGVLNTYSTLVIHDALNAGAITPEFDRQLRDLLGGIVEKLHGTFGALKESLMKDQALTPFDVWQKALATGVAPFASSLNAAPMAISERERHAMEQVEVTVREALGHKETTTRQAYRELRRLYDEMRETVKPSDFNSQVEYDFVFAVTPDAEGRSEHLARFAAFGLANQQFGQILERLTTSPIRRIRDGQTFGERFQIFWEQVLEFFHGDLAMAYGGQQASSKLSQVVGKLVDVEARKRTLLATQGSTLSAFDQTANKVSAAGRKAVNDLLGSQFIRNNKSPFVRAAGAVGRITANQQVMHVLDVLADFRNKNFDETYGVMAGYLNELRGPGELLNSLQLAATSQQRERRTRISQTSKHLREAFVNGADMAKATKDAITKVFLRTGMHHLIGDGRFNMAELEHMLGNKQAVAAAINTLESQLAGFGALKDHYVLHANDLAYFTVTGKARRETLMLNAHNIARVYDKLGNHVTAADATRAEKIIEQLVPLYAIGMLKEADVIAARDTLHAENARTDAPNAVEFVLGLHKAFEEQSRAKLFEGQHQQALMGHGYTPDILNPHTEIKAADDAEGEQLRYAGYSAEGAVQLDPADPNQDKRRLYVLRDGGLQQQVTGSMSYTGKNSKGHTVHSGFLNVNTGEGAANASTHAGIMAVKMNSTLDSGPRPDLSRGAQRSYMVPIVNPQGAIVNWRYMMNAETKDNILERNNSFDDVMGALAGSIYDKETTPELNAKVVGALKDVYKAEHATNSKSFLRIGPSSTDPRLVEIWRMLPDETRAEIRRVWGRDGMYVRKDQINTVFGYRKFSLAETFKKDPAMRECLEKVFAWSVEHMLTVIGNGAARFLTDPAQQQQRDEFLNYAKRAAIMVTRGERIWQGIVRETKDIIVVRSITVMLGNIKGNFTLLAAQGVKPSDIVSGHLVAMRAARDYQNNIDEIAELRAKLDTKVVKGSTAEMERRLIVLRDAVARNPIKKLVDLGLMPTIAEDVATDDPYAYQNYFTKKADELKDKAISVLNPKVVSTVKNIYMAKDTAVYQGLSRITQLSDFAARYVLFKHLTERAENPLSEQEATFEASEAFVNYDIPMHHGLQYMDDMGFLMFIKYFMRMQRVLIRTAKDNPGRVMTSVALHHFIGSIPSVLESSWMTRVGNNPFTWGALQFPSSLLDLGSVSSAMRLLK